MATGPGIDYRTGRLNPAMEQKLNACSHAGEKPVTTAAGPDAEQPMTDAHHPARSLVS
jgi:hypothetical protein